MSDRFPARPCCGVRAIRWEHYRRFLFLVVYRLQRSREGPSTRGSYKDAAGVRSRFGDAAKQLDIESWAEACGSLRRSGATSNPDLWFSFAGSRYQATCPSARCVRFWQRDRTKKIDARKFEPRSPELRKTQKVSKKLNVGIPARLWPQVRLWRAERNGLSADPRNHRHVPRDQGTQADSSHRFDPSVRYQWCESEEDVINAIRLAQTCGVGWRAQTEIRIHIRRTPRFKRPRTHADTAV